MTLAQFRTAISAKIGLDNTAASAEQSLMDGWINEGVVEVLLRTHCYVTSASTTLTANVGDYTLDSNILALTGLSYTSASVTYDLERVTLEQILSLRRNTSTGPCLYYAVDGANLLLLWPNASSGDTLTMYYVPRPTALSSSSDDPSTASKGGVPTEYHKAIEYYALWQAGDYADDDSSKRGDMYRVYFEDWVHRSNKDIRKRGGRRLARAVVGKRRGYIPARNDIA